MSALFVDDGSRARNESRARRRRDERFAGHSTARARAVRDDARAMRGALCRAAACQRWQPPVGRGGGRFFPFFRDIFSFGEVVGVVLKYEESKRARYDAHEVAMGKSRGD